MGPIDHPAEGIPEVVDDPLAPRFVAVIAGQPPLVVEHGLDFGSELGPIVAGGAGQVMEQAAEVDATRPKVRSPAACSTTPRTTAGARFRWAYDRSSRNSLWPVHTMNKSGW